LGWDEPARVVTPFAPLLPVAHPRGSADKAALSARANTRRERPAPGANHFNTALRREGRDAVLVRLSRRGAERRGRTPTTLGVGGEIAK